MLTFAFMHHPYIFSCFFFFVFFFLYTKTMFHLSAWAWQKNHAVETNALSLISFPFPLYVCILGVQCLLIYLSANCKDCFVYTFLINNQWNFLLPWWSCQLASVQYQKYIFQSIAKQVAQLKLLALTHLTTLKRLHTYYLNLIQAKLLFSTFFPMLGGRTPSYGYMTPSHDPSQTPLHGGSAWDPTISNTPARYASKLLYVAR